LGASFQSRIFHRNKLVGAAVVVRVSVKVKIIAVTNIKGGVGKTTTAVNLSYLCAAAGRPTLLWDLDPQGAATYTLRCDPNEHVSAKQLVAGKRELPEVLVPSGYERLDILPSDFSYRNFDLHLSERKHPTERLLKMSRSLRDVYSTLFLDCPPGISLLSENVLRAADALVVPLVPTPLSIRMLTQLRDFILENQWTDLALLPFFSMVDRRKSLHQDMIGSTREQFPEMLTTEVPYWSEIERMSLRRGPLPAYAPASAAARVYSALWSEVDARIEHRPAVVAIAPEAAEYAVPEPGAAEPGVAEPGLRMEDTEMADRGAGI
jgi:chromosome partitioning protein